MRALTLGIGIAALAGLAQPATAQCGCGMQSAAYAPPMHYMQPAQYMQPAPYAQPMTVQRPSRPAVAPMASIAFVNQLSTPIDRGNYVLNYAVHLTDGRILLTDFMPKGHTVSGTEHRTGGRRVAARVGEQGRVIVRDPQNDQTITTF